MLKKFSALFFFSTAVLISTEKKILALRNMYFLNDSHSHTSLFIFSKNELMFVQIQMNRTDISTLNRK